MATTLKDFLGRITGSKSPLSFITSSAKSMLVLSALVGLGAGLAAVLFRWMLDFFHIFFFETLYGWLSFLGLFSIILIPAIGAVLFSPIIYFFAREAKGHGVPEVMLATEQNGGKIRPRVALIKSIASSLCIGSGGSAGREGPVVQLGSALGSTFGQLLRLNDERTKNLVACGAAAGIAATFNAPIGGLFFALEVILRDFSMRRIGNVVIASVTASVIAKILLGNETFIATPAYAIKSPVELLFYIALGLIIAPLAILFVRSLYKFEDFFDALKIHDLVKPVIGALCLGVIGLFFPQVFGVGYENIEGAVHATTLLHFLLILIPLKMLAVCFTLGSGGSGGVFAPSLVLGSIIGAAFGMILSLIFPELGIEPGAYALVGMAAFFAGAAHAPMSAFLIMFELTGDYLIILPLMLAVTITTALSEKLHRESIYTLKLVRRGIDIKKERVRDIMESIKVGEILGKAGASVLPSAPIDEIIMLVEKENRASVTVVDSDGVYHGLITIDAIITLLRHSESLQYVVVAGDIAKNVPCIAESASLKDAMKSLVESGMDILPVVRKVEEGTKLTGTVSKHDLLSAYRREVSVRKG
ncbi:MAG: chloride channel protein [Thermodesulfobacteriota bacterium]